MPTIEKKIYYHIDRKGNFFEIGKTYFIGKDKNPFLSLYDKENFTIQDPITKEWWSISEIIIRMLVSDGKNDELLSHLRKEDFEKTKNYFNDYLILIREIIFEEVRRDFFPNIPSRYKCLWVIPNDISAVQFWWYELGKKGKVLKLELTGKIYEVNQEYLKLNTNSLDYIRMQAFKYWSSISGNNKLGNEFLFEGFVTILEIVNPDSYQL